MTKDNHRHSSCGCCLSCPAVGSLQLPLFLITYCIWSKLVCFVGSVWADRCHSFWNCWSEAGSFYRILFGFIMAPLCKPLAPHCVSSHCRSAFFLIACHFFVCFLLTGQSGLGKSTLMNTLFKSKVSRKSVLATAQEKIPKTVEIKSISHGTTHHNWLMPICILTACLCYSSLLLCWLSVFLCAFVCRHRGEGCKNEADSHWHTRLWRPDQQWELVGYNLTLLQQPYKHYKSS